MTAHAQKNGNISTNGRIPHRTGVVLAAGFGSRLAGTNHAPDLKPLTPVAGKPLIVRTLDSLARAGCDRAVIVLGYKPEILRSAIEAVYEGPLDLQFAVNPRYRMKNGLSVLAAGEHVTDPFVLVMADHVLSDEMMELARQHTPKPGGATLLVDYKLDTIFDMEDATKVQVEGEKIVAIGKELTSFNGVDTGVFVATAGLLEALETVLEDQGDASLSDGVRRLAETGRMHALDIGNAFWQDVDTPAMLARAAEVLKEQTYISSSPVR